jgi:ABC-type phosphate transport system permease subunit
MLGILMMLACFAGVVFLAVKGIKSVAWHKQGVGERHARAEYARIQREQPDSAGARQSEAEFVRDYVASRPGIARYFVGGLLLVLIGMPVSCALGIFSSHP